jgi:hypothetical protein
MRVSSQDGVLPYRATRNLIDCSSNKPPASPMKTILSLLGMSILWIVNALAVPSSTSVATSIDRATASDADLPLHARLSSRRKAYSGTRIGASHSKCPLLEQDARNLRSMETSLCGLDASKITAMNSLSSPGNNISQERLTRYENHRL